MSSVIPKEPRSAEIARRAYLQSQRAIAGNHRTYTALTDATVAETRLRDAAPDLLAALKALAPEGWLDDDTMDHMPGVRQARAAIAKAEGRNPHP